jgi:protein CWC15
LEAEKAARAKKSGGVISSGDDEDVASKLGEQSHKRAIEDGDVEDEEDGEAKRRRILEETRDIDADSDGGSGSDDDEEDDEEDSDEDDEEDETAELLRELEKIKRERAEQREKEEREKEEKEREKKEFDIARGNPLLNPKSTADFNVKRRWDDDVIFKNQARGTDDKNKKKEFVNDLLRSDFHKKFMVCFLRTESAWIGISTNIIIEQVRPIDCFAVIILCLFCLVSIAFPVFTTVFLS